MRVSREAIERRFEAETRSRALATSYHPGHDALRRFVMRTNVSTVTIKGDGHNSKKLESCSGFKIKKIVQSRVRLALYCSCSLSLSSSSFFLSSVSRHILYHIYTRQERRESKRTMKTNLSIAVWWDPFNCLPLGRTPLPSAPTSAPLSVPLLPLFFLIFRITEERKPPREDWGFIHLLHRYLILLWLRLLFTLSSHSSSFFLSLSLTYLRTPPLYLGIFWPDCRITDRTRPMDRV